MINYIVQAWAIGLGYVDCKTAETYQEAQQLEQELIANDDAWFSVGLTKNPPIRLTKIIPVAEARCQYPKQILPYNLEETHETSKTP